MLQIENRTKAEQSRTNVLKLPQGRNAASVGVKAVEKDLEPLAPLWGYLTSQKKRLRLMNLNLRVWMMT